MILSPRQSEHQDLPQGTEPFKSRPPYRVAAQVRAVPLLSDAGTIALGRVLDGTLSTLKLSQGQRKRLALLTAYLEDRPFYLFDEWASDQDPQFKEVFYTQLLPDLRARGKTVLVITHDDKYFPLADRLIKLDYGKLVEEPLEPVPWHDSVLQASNF